jgi:hypothetical protein
MKKTIVVVSMVLLTAACSGTPDQTPSTATETELQRPPAAAPVEVLEEPTSAATVVSTSSLPADVETYYKTMVFIQGTAQLMARIDLAGITSSDNQAAFLPLMTMPGVMDDHVIAASALPVPGGLETAWGKAADAEAGLIQALQDFLMSYSQDDFIQAVTSNEAMASEAVAGAEAVLAAQYGASADDIAAANRAALTEMGETYQTFASMILAGQAQSDDGSE